MSADRNCLTYWFPRLVAAGVPVPRTEVVTVDDGEGGWSLTAVCDGKEPPALAPLVAGIRAAADRLGGYPVFLRTGQGSGKHDWSRCCDLRSADAVPAHVAALVEWSHLQEMLGLRHDVWCVRERLPVAVIVHLPRYGGEVVAGTVRAGGMPLVKEVRAFVAGGAVRCWHPYWPADAVAEGLGLRDTRSPGLRRLLDGVVEAATPTAADEPHWRPVAERVAAAFAGDGAWSVDLLATRNGWFVTDMAEAGRSFHWPGCPHAAGG